MVIIGNGILDIYEGETLVIKAGRWDVLFEFHDHLGPMPVTKTGNGRNLGPRHPFWRAVTLWSKQGKRSENGRAIYDIV